MKNIKKTVRFKGEEYLFGGASLDEPGFIATREQYENGLCSFAHYSPGEGVKRFGARIGGREDLEIVGETEADVNIVTALSNLAAGWRLP